MINIRYLLQKLTPLLEKFASNYSFDATLILQPEEFQYLANHHCFDPEYTKPDPTCEGKYFLRIISSNIDALKTGAIMKIAQPFEIQ